MSDPHTSQKTVFSQPWFQAAWPFLVLTLAWFLFWWPVVCGENQLYMRDLTFYALPMKATMMARFLAGEFPFWTPHISTGIPFFAEPSHQVLYPFNLVFFLTPTLVHGLSWFAILHLLFGMWAFYGLTRILQLPKMLGIWAALVYGMSGYNLSITDNVNYLTACLWVPLVFTCLIRGLQTDRLHYPALGSLCVTMLLFAGDSFNSLFLGVFSTLLILLRWRSPTLFPGATFQRSLLHLTVLFGLGGLMAAVQLLPTYELMQISVRQKPLHIDETTLWSFPPQRIIEFIQPFFYGSKYPTPHFIGQFLYPKFMEAWVDSIFIGLIPVLAGGFAVLFRFRQASFWLLIVILSLFLGFGVYGSYYPALLEIFPPLKYHRYLEKFVFWTGFGLCVLAGIGADAVLKNKNNLAEKFARFPHLKKALWTLGLLLGSMLLVVKIPADLWIWTHARENSSDWGKHFYERGPHVWYLATHWAILSTAVILALWVPVRIWGKYLHFLLILALINLVYMHYNHVPTGPTELLAHPNQPEALRIMATDHAQPPYRIYYEDEVGHNDHPKEPKTMTRLAKAFNRPHLQDHYEYTWLYRVLYAQERLLFNYGILHGMNYLNGRFAPLQPLHHNQMDKVLLQYAPQLLMELSNIRYIITPVTPSNPDWEAPGYTEIGKHRKLNLKVVRVDNAVPRVYLSPNPIYNPDPIHVYKILTPNFQGQPLQQQVEIAALPPPGYNKEGSVPQVPLQPSQVEIVQDRPEEIQVDIISPYSSSYLVLTESFFPGWRAWVDGQPAPVFLANHRFMAVPVPQGSHQVQFRYFPTQFYTGLFISLLSLLLCLGLIFNLPSHLLTLKQKGSY